MTRKEMIIDLDECTGCDLCLIACKDEHVGNEYLPWTKPQPGTGHFWMNVHSMERGQIPKVRVTYLPLLCQHCENAPCMKVCPEDAIERREDGLVWINHEECTGCGLCQEACPYDVIYMNEELNVAQKCTGCAHLVDQGKEPRCADACPHEAIVFGDEDDPKIVKLKARTEVLHPEFQANPRVFYKGLPKPFLSGTFVSDGEVVPDVAVAVTDLFDDSVVKTTSDNFGDFWVRNLSKGHIYKLDYSKDGYKGVTAVVTADKDRNIGEIPLARLDG